MKHVLLAARWRNLHRSPVLLLNGKLCCPQMRHTRTWIIPGDKRIVTGLFPYYSTFVNPIQYNNSNSSSFRLVFSWVKNTEIIFNHARISIIFFEKVIYLGD